MGVLVALTIGLVFWICAWSFGMLALDAFLVTALLVVIAVTIKTLKPFVDRVLGNEPAQL
jgi:hypothetical protein